MADYEPSAEEIEAALTVWFPHPERGWNSGTAWSHRNFWRQAMRDALVAAHAARDRPEASETGRRLTHSDGRGGSTADA